MHLDREQVQRHRDQPELRLARHLASLVQSDERVLGQIRRKLGLSRQPVEVPEQPGKLRREQEHESLVK